MATKINFWEALSKIDICRHVSWIKDHRFRHRYIINAICLTAESLTSSLAAILSQASFLAGSVVPDVR